MKMSQKRYDFIIERMKKGHTDNRIAREVSSRFRISMTAAAQNVTSVWRDLGRSADYSQKRYHRDRISTKLEYLFSEAMHNCSLEALIQELEDKGVPPEAWKGPLMRYDPLRAIETCRKMLDSLSKLQGLNEAEKLDVNVNHKDELKSLTNSERETRIDQLLAERAAARAAAKALPKGMNGTKKGEAN
jgi:hypothetical protein